MKSIYTHSEEYYSEKKEFYDRIYEVYALIGENISSDMQNKSARKLIDVYHLKIHPYELQRDIVLDIARSKG